MASISLKRITSTWIITVMVLFVIAILFGITMRFNQGKLIQISPTSFYSIMTVHGLTMIGIWSVAGLAAIHYLLSRYLSIPTSISVFAFIFTVLGVVMLWSSAFIGEFHAGWTFLYPLPFKVAWKSWATPLFLSGLAVLGVAWLVWSVGILYQILKKYTITQTLGWQHFSTNPSIETPPLILISTVSLIGIIVCLLSAVVLLVLFFAEYFSNGAYSNDPLLMKNITYFFGHTIANETLYLGLASLYELMPEISKKPKFKTTWYVALAWNCTLVFILTAFFHHLYMDFVQPLGFQMIGQLASYFASLPAAAVTAFSVAVLVYKNQIRWSLSNILFFLGVMGWIIGGIGALIDATISNNIILHNTLWVPAHFHTYNAMGNVLFSLAFFVWVANDFSDLPVDSGIPKFIISLLVLGGFGFVLMFYLGGAMSIPRRFALYPPEFNNLSWLATLGGWFAVVYLISILFIFFTILKKCLKVFSAS
ncbi:MAG: cbb3-type cytochrome c oxidase subunit I [Chitinophagales bacterium]|nr:cbb3-type cytochrome c oxidase subunit I [Chitinophagales bacterium]MCZ2392372.1 cbb3-type cytochrome c oxidase subunit I [Chitinophagales bacterium]